jgi:hypothetical protein
MKQNQKQNMTEEELRIDNEVRKLRLSMEWGAQFSNIPGVNHEEITPEIEKICLDHVERMERAMKNAKEILLFDFIGKPNLRKEEELSDEEIPLELENLEFLLEGHGIICGAKTEISARTMYKFLTEELLNLQTLNLRVPGFVKFYSYETFHPNEVVEVTELGLDFLELIFHENYGEYLDYNPNEHIRNFCDFLLFRDAYEKLLMVEQASPVVEITGHLATMKIQLKYDAFPDISQPPVHFEGEAILKLMYENDEWVISFIYLPGMPDE